MADWKCPFCGSPKRKIDTPYVKRANKLEDGEIKMEPISTFCCAAQKKNYEYMSKRFGGNPADWPDQDEVGRL